MTVTSTNDPQGAPVQGNLVGREIAGRYRLKSLLGQGGMGAVYLAEQISLRRTVAVKVLRPELSADASLVRRFNSEAELAAKLNHPNTVSIFDFGQDVDGTMFIAMEHVEGESLREAVQQGPMTMQRALHIVSQVASSLADAHARGITHRDLKPDNVMLTSRGREIDVVRVLDFGIAKLRDDGRGTQQNMTQAGDMLGTPQYMAPEQIRGDTVDGRTDVYALGAILYELVTGRMPFEGPTVMALLSKHLTQLPEQPSVRRPDLGISQQLDAIVMRALIKDVEHRTPSMEKFSEEIAELGGITAAMAAPFARPSEVTSAPVAPGYSAPTPASRNLAPFIGPAASETPGAAKAWLTPAGAVSRPAMATPAQTLGPMPTPTKSRAGLYVVIGLVAAGGIGAAIWAVNSSSTSGADDLEPPEGPVARAAAGYGVVLPAEFTQVSNGGVFTVVARRGATELIACLDIDRAVPFELEPLADVIAQTTESTRQQPPQWFELRGERFMHGYFGAVEEGSLVEVVAYQGANYYFTCGYMADAATFNAASALREDLFTRRIVLPP